MQRAWNRILGPSIQNRLKNKRPVPVPSLYNTLNNIPEVSSTSKFCLLRNDRLRFRNELDGLTDGKERLGYETSRKFLKKVKKRAREEFENQTFDWSQVFDGDDSSSEEEPVVAVRPLKSRKQKKSNRGKSR